MSSQKTNDSIPDVSIKINQENIIQKLDSKVHVHNISNMYEEDIYYKYYLEKDKITKLATYNNYIHNHSPNPLNMYEEYTM